MLFLRALGAVGVSLFVLTVLPSLSAAAVGEVALGGGPIVPRAAEGKYSETGAALFLRASTRLGPAQGVSAWGDIGYDFFRMKHRETVIPVPDGPTIPVEEQTEESAAYGHVGIQFNSPSRNALIRPRAGVGVGLYYFWTETYWHQGDVLDEIASVTLDKQWRPGWRAIVGADLFVSRKIGISVDFKYDRVSGLNHVVEDGRRNDDGLFYSYTLGVVFAFDTKEKKKTTKAPEPSPEEGAVLAR
jgi:hypothetical protein